MITKLNVASIFVLDKDEALDFYVNKLGLEKPMSKQISVTLRSVSRRRNIERSTRRRWRYRCGVSPKQARKLRLKCAGDTWATAAMARTSSGSA